MERKMGLHSKRGWKPMDEISHPFPPNGDFLRLFHPTPQANKSFRFPCKTRRFFILSPQNAYEIRSYMGDSNWHLPL